MEEDWVSGLVLKHRGHDRGTALFEEVDEVVDQLWLDQRLIAHEKNGRLTLWIDGFQTGNDGRALSLMSFFVSDQRSFLCPREICFFISFHARVTQITSSSLEARAASSVH